ncbi:MAG: hypothetical protein CVV05_18660 [Gammaproteobacteria bacterium HGW-Gammaproteobacteria-1]|jgi:hypothetical protein|nr:MAG: hypothetical protein CVV05_18660 [Gammaproteobacteria bacterium HGW-Gammaproteobacteria-1]
MKKLFAIVLLAGLSLAIATGCRTSTPIYNVQDATIVTNSDKPATATDVKKAILRAGTSLGWNMKEEKPGHIIGTLHLRTHMAQIDIKYSPSSYSITYRDSQNLNYDGTNIHGNYNGWVQRLQQNIQSQMNLM